MRPLRFSINVTLDGCYDHRAGIPNEALHHHAARRIAEADAMLFGRVTYQMMEEAWREPGRTGERPGWMEEWMLPFARTIDAAKKVVVSGTLNQVDWNAELVRPAELKETVLRLKAQPGKGIAVAGVKLAHTLTELGLIDEYELVMHPRFAGHGPYLFAGLPKYVDLKPVGRIELADGLVAVRYQLGR